MRPVPRALPRPIDDTPPGLMQCRRCRQWHNVFDGPHDPNCPATLGTMSKIPSWVPPLPPVQKVQPRQVA
jgi:hypothetical protein